MHDPQIDGRRRGSHWILALCVLLGVIACSLDKGTRRSYAPVPRQDWQAERGPVVPHDSFPADCSLCHAGSSWHSIRDDFSFDHADATGVALNGAHARAECLRCHNDRGPVERFAARGCAGCHEDVHTGKLGWNCADCHEETHWKPREFVVEHARTRFPLVASHAAAACWSCHPGASVGNLAPTGTRCTDCHSQDLARATSPDHAAQGWVDRCERCHAPTTWNHANFDHAFFPLTGQHTSLTCARCHPNDAFHGTPNTCAGCHQADYDATTQPNHAGAQFPVTCEVCHSTSNWDSTFTHQTFVIDGAHTHLQCNACHAGGVFAGTPTLCFGCHANDYNHAEHHVSNHYPTTCEECHSTSNWDAEGGNLLSGARRHASKSTDRAPIAPLPVPPRRATTPHPH